jgi:hypothetical protein
MPRHNVHAGNVTDQSGQELLVKFKANKQNLIKIKTLRELERGNSVIFIFVCW